MMSFQDDVVYIVLLVFSIVIGGVLRQFAPLGPIHRRLASGIGLGILFLVSGIHGLHCLVCYGLQALLVLTLPTKTLHTASFFLQFLYLFFFRLGGTFLPHLISHPPPHTNAIQMILTLKMIGVAFEIHDTKILKAKADKTDQEQLQLKHQGVDPTVIDIFHYAFSYAGLLTGPYYKYRTFHDLYHQTFSSKVDTFKATKRRILNIVLYVGLFLLASYIFPLKDVEDPKFYDNSSIWFRLFYMTPVFFAFRMRLYTGFVLSECSCINTGLGAYPTQSKPTPGHGPKNYEALENDHDDYNFETVHNIDEYGAEFVPTMREALKTWNMTVQYWLAVIVYKRFPIKSVRTVAVMIVSSVWHGVYSGYYLSLGSVPLVLFVEDFCDKAIRSKLLERSQKVYDWISWFLRMQAFSYLGMAFQLLRIDLTWQFWRSIYFIGHLSLPVIYGIVWTFKSVMKKRE